MIFTANIVASSTAWPPKIRDSAGLRSVVGQHCRDVLQLVHKKFTKLNLYIKAQIYFTSNPLITVIPVKWIDFGLKYKCWSDRPDSIMAARIENQETCGPVDWN